MGDIMHQYQKQTQDVLYMDEVDTYFKIASK